jgi:hypothetical protein
MPRPIIQNASGDAGLPRNVVEGLLNNAVVNVGQMKMIDGLISDSSRGGDKASQAPIVATGSYVGAPSMPRGASIKARNPKTSKPAGQMLPVGQN